MLRSSARKPPLHGLQIMVSLPSESRHQAFGLHALPRRIRPRIRRLVRDFRAGIEHAPAAPRDPAGRFQRDYAEAIRVRVPAAAGVVRAGSGGVGG